ncbi:glycosyltransferase [Streptomyces sp. NPDC056231]|uniref:glycosyltransferase n=1 Tax=Streptomyces sp. NPDC056231 TaxID=3345755 RepID=UPI003AABFAF8
MRVLVASTSGSGHFSPLVPFIDACAVRGDDVLVVAPPKLEPLLAARKQPYHIGGEPPQAELVPLMMRVLGLPADEGVSLMTREVFGRLCITAMLPTLEELCREWRPDLVLHETYELASVVAAERHGVPHAQVAVSVAQFTESTDELLRPALDSYGTGIAERLRVSPYLTRLPASLDPSPYAVTRRYHQPPASNALPDWWHGREEPLVYVTLGTEVGGMPNASALYRTVLASVSGLPARVLLTTGPFTDVSDFGAIPRNVRVEKWVPQADVLGGASLVLCHGGSGTVYGALASGVPLVCLPLFADQPTNARLVTEAGAGLTVTADGPGQEAAGFGPDGVAGIRSAVELVLKNPSYRAGAERLTAEMCDTPTAGELLDSLEACPAPGPR